MNMNTCEKHKSNDEETALSPQRYKCRICLYKKINGYTNPDHISNPFGYLYLAPTICDECSIKNNKCRWCDIT